MSPTIVDSVVGVGVAASLCLAGYGVWKKEWHVFWTGIGIYSIILTSALFSNVTLP